MTASNNNAEITLMSEVYNRIDVEFAARLPQKNLYVQLREVISEITNEMKLPLSSNQQDMMAINMCDAFAHEPIAA